MHTIKAAFFFTTLASSPRVFSLLHPLTHGKVGMAELHTVKEGWLITLNPGRFVSGGVLCDPVILIFPLNGAVSMCECSQHVWMQLVCVNAVSMCECGLLLLRFLCALFSSPDLEARIENGAQTCKDEGIAVDTVALLLQDWTSPPLSANVTINLIMTHLTRASPLPHLHILLFIKVKLHVEAVLLEPTMKKEKQPRDRIKARYISSVAEMRGGRKNGSLHLDWEAVEQSGKQRSVSRWLLAEKEKTKETLCCRLLQRTQFFPSFASDPNGHGCSLPAESPPRI